MNRPRLDADRLRRAIYERDGDLRSAADRIGISRTALHNNLMGHSLPTLPVVCAYAAYCGCTVDELVEYERRVL